MTEALLLLLVLALVWAAWTDLRQRLIPNRITLAIALAAPLWWWASHWPLWPGVGVQLLLAIAALLAFSALFALGAMGGGDVKLIAALALWLPPSSFLLMLVAMALLGGGVTVATVVWHRLGRRLGRPEIPYGIAISLAGLWVIANQLLTISGQ